MNQYIRTSLAAALVAVTAGAATARTDDDEFQEGRGNYVVTPLVSNLAKKCGNAGTELGFRHRVEPTRK